MRLKHLGNAILLIFSLCIIGLITGCAPTHVQTLQQYGGPPLPKPRAILVYNFAVSPDVVQLNSGAGSRLTNGNPEQAQQQKMQIAQAVANSLTNELVKELRADGLPAQAAGYGTPSLGNVVLITGQFLAINEGNRARRMIVGFGAGHTEVDAHVQVISTLRQPSQMLYAFDTTAESSRKPGMGPMIGVGAAAGHAAESTVVSGTLGTVSEFHGASVQADASRTAKKINQQLIPFFEQQGWLTH